MHIESEIHEYGAFYPERQVCLQFRLFAVSQRPYDQVHVSARNYADEIVEEDAEDAKDGDWDNGDDELFDSHTKAAWHLIKVIHNLDQDEWTSQFVQLNLSMNRVRITSNLISMSLAEIQAMPGKCSHEDVCSFEPGSECKEWFQKGLNEKSVQIVQARDGVCNRLPHKDTSTTSAYGHYLRLFKMDSESTLRRIFQLSLTNRHARYWLDMQLYMPSEQCMKLNVFVEYGDDDDHQSRQMIWSSDQIYADERWQRVLVPFDLNIGFKPTLVIASEQSPAHEQDTVALDDLQIKFGHTHQMGSCNFDYGFCAYTNVEPANVRWIHGVGRLEKDKRVGLPSISEDDSIDIRRHLYLDLTWLQPGSPNVIALLRSELLRPVRNGGCAMLTYNFFCPQAQAQAMHFKVFQSSTTKREEKFQAKASTQKGFLISQFDVISSSPFVLELEFWLDSVRQQVPSVHLREIQYFEKPCAKNMEDAFDEEMLEEDNQIDRKTADLVERVQTGLNCAFDVDVCNFDKSGIGWHFVSNALEAKSANLPLVDGEGGKFAYHNDQ